MEPIVAPAKIAGMMVSALLSGGVPIALAVLWHKRTRAKWSAFFIGAITFYVFVNFLEGSLHAFCLGLITENAVSAFLKATPWAYVLYAGFAAGLFEETGRFVAFRWLLRKQTGRETGVMYGIGHGGIEAILLCCVAMFSNIAFAVSLNAAGAEAMLAQAGAQAAAVQGSIDIMTQTPAAIFYVSGIERIIAIALHIALSVLVFAAASRKEKRFLYPVAIVLHAAVDCFAVLYQLGVITNIWFVELGVGAMTVLIALYALRVYRASRAEAPPDAQPPDAAAASGQSCD